MDLNSEQKQIISSVGRQHKLDMILLHGSKVTGNKISPDPDTDIAIYRNGGVLFLVWKDESGKSKRLVYSAFGVQMVLNALWSIIFFGLHSPGGALVEVVFLWFAILATIITFAKISKPAAWFLVPYIAWVSFAMYLNYSIYALN